MSGESGDQAPAAFSQTETHVGPAEKAGGSTAEGDVDSDAAAPAVVIDTMQDQMQREKQRKQKKKKKSIEKTKISKNNRNNNNDNNDTNNNNNTDSNKNDTDNSQIPEMTCIDAYIYITLIFDTIAIYISFFSLIIGYNINSFWDTYSNVSNNDCFDEYYFTADTFITFSWIVFIFTIIITIIGIIRNYQINKLRKDIFFSNKKKKKKKKKKSKLQIYKIRKNDLLLTKCWISCIYFTIFGIISIGCIVLINSLSSAKIILNTVSTDDNIYCNDDSGSNIDQDEAASIADMIDTLWIVFAILFIIAIIITFKFWKGTPSSVFAAACSYFYV